MKGGPTLHHSLRLYEKTPARSPRQTFNIITISARAWTLPLTPEWQALTIFKLIIIISHFSPLPCLGLYWRPLISSVPWARVVHSRTFLRHQLSVLRHNQHAGILIYLGTVHFTHTSNIFLKILSST